MVELQLGRETRDGSTEDLTLAETGRRIGAIRPVRRSTELPAGAFLIECHGVEVNLSPVGRSEHDSDGSMILGHHKPDPFKGTQHLGERLQLHDEVNVVMGAGFFAEEHIDSPPSIEPHTEGDSLEGIKDFENVGSFHRLFVYQA
jgi:hypothetical protein